MHAQTARPTRSPLPPARLRPARVSVRVAAYLVDWLVMVIIASTLISVGGVQLYLLSDAGRSTPPDASLYVFGLCVVLAAPLWAVATWIGWSLSGRSVGKLALGVRVVNHKGVRPGWGRAGMRLLVYLAEGVPIMTLPVLIAVRLRTTTPLPGWAVPTVAIVALIGIASLLPAVTHRGGLTLHDRLAGTLVIED